MKKYALAITLLALGIILCAISVILLPTDVITQISVSGSANTMPKMVAIAIPSLLVLAGTIACIVGKRDTNKSLVLSVAGNIVFAVMLTVNCII